jgi:hypothetical protein
VKRFTDTASLLPVTALQVPQKRECLELDMKYSEARRMAKELNLGNVVPLLVAAKDVICLSVKSSPVESATRTLCGRYQGPNGARYVRVYLK